LTVRRWLSFTGGLLIWAAHFLGVYVIASLADVVATADDPAWRSGGVIFSLVCLAGIAVLAVGVFRSGRSSPDAWRGFERAVALGACLIGGVGIVFQTLPLLLT